MVVTVVFSGIPQYVTLTDLAYHLDKLFDSDEVGTFRLRDLHPDAYTKKRHIAIDFNSGFDAMTAQEKLHGYTYVLDNGASYTLQAKVKRSSPSRFRTTFCRSPSPERHDTDRHYKSLVPKFASEHEVHKANAMLDAQLSYLKKKKQIIETEKEIVHEKRRLEKEYKKYLKAVDLNSDSSRSRSKSQDRYSRSAERHSRSAGRRSRSADRRSRSRRRHGKRRRSKKSSRERERSYKQHHQQSPTTEHKLQLTPVDLPEASGKSREFNNRYDEASSRSRECNNRYDEASSRSRECTNRYDEASSRSRECNNRYDEASSRSRECTNRYDEASSRSRECTNRYDKASSRSRECNNRYDEASSRSRKCTNRYDSCEIISVDRSHKTKRMRLDTEQPSTSKIKEESHEIEEDMTRLKIEKVKDEIEKDMETVLQTNFQIKQYDRSLALIKIREVLNGRFQRIIQDVSVNNMTINQILNYYRSRHYNEGTSVIKTILTNNAIDYFNKDNQIDVVKLDRGSPQEKPSLELADEPIGDKDLADLDELLMDLPSEVIQPPSSLATTQKQ